MKKRLVVLSGAGVSAESGIPTFRGSDGLWEGHRVEDVASPEGWARDPEMVLNFYNERRNVVRSVKPNRGHQVLSELEEYFDVTVITQNIDNLHERAGSTDVLHLHGEILKARSESSLNPKIYDLGDKNIFLGDHCEMGHQLRPHIVWFGEPVPMMENAIRVSLEADVFIVVGTSLAVYPAAGLIQYTSAQQKFIVDPVIPEGVEQFGFKGISEPGSSGLEKVFKLIVEST